MTSMLTGKLAESDRPIEYVMSLQRVEYGQSLG